MCFSNLTSSPGCTLPVCVCSYMHLHKESAREPLGTGGAEVNASLCCAVKLRAWMKLTPDLAEPRNQPELMKGKAASGRGIWSGDAIRIKRQEVN